MFDCELLMSAGGEEETTRGVSKRTMWGVTVQEEHDGLEEEDRSDPEGRGAHGPARPSVAPGGEEEHERTRPGRSRRELVGRARGLRGRAVPPSWHLRRSG